MRRLIRTLVTAALVAPLFSGMAQAETLRLLTWGNYAPEEVIRRFEERYPDIKVEVTYSNNEEMIAKLRATGGAGFDLAQPGFNRVAAAQEEFGIYKPLDLSKINLDRFDPTILERVKADTTLNGEVYAVPHQWGASGIMVDITKAPDVKTWTDLCDEKYKGKTSMRLRRSILVGMAFAMGEDPFASYGDLAKYKELMNKVGDYLIACKPNVKAYWTGGDDLSALMLSGEVVAAETWDSTAFRLGSQNPNIVFVPPATGALGWIDSFALPRKGQADDAAYKWINFVLEPEIVPLMAASSGATTAVKDGVSLMPADKRAAVERAYKPADIENIKWAARILPGVEDIEGEVLERIKAAN
jgi:spermidine/putrescine transport system substrate-binding protein